MLKSREYISFSLEGDTIKVARVQPYKKGLKLVRLDKLKLIHQLESKKEETVKAEDIFEDEDDDSVFGLDDDLDTESIDLDEIDLDSIDDQEQGLEAMDLVEETDLPKSNEELIFKYLAGLGKSKPVMSLNIPSGSTIFQIFKETNFKEIKKKELLDFIEDKLQSIYGHPPEPDFYSYYTRDDGSLVLSSVDEESPTLALINRAKEQFDKNYFIQDVIPDEVAMVGLYRNHYEPDERNITGLLQLGQDKCRMIFLRNHDVLQVSPVINEGTSKKGFLNTIFSKILFQLDTGEIPGLDRIILFNNNQGEKAIGFFKENFPDLDVQNFTFNRDKFIYDDSLEDLVAGFTTAIGVASTAANVGMERFPQLSFLPAYVSDRQKIFKLQWHGVILLLLIGLSPVVLNHFYQKYATEIEQLQGEQNRLETSIADIEPLVAESEELTTALTQMQGQLSLLTDLSNNNIRWTVTLNEFNRAVEETGGLWINSFRQNQDVIMIDGYSTNRNRIPELAIKFPSVTLLSVRREEIRERDIFYFNMMLRTVVEDESRFTPQNSREIEELLNL
ncbi:MAG: hypothetical protein WEA56_00865 [Balneolaceae bacterium]